MKRQRKRRSRSLENSIATASLFAYLLDIACLLLLSLLIEHFINHRYTDHGKLKFENAI